MSICDVALTRGALTKPVENNSRVMKLIELTVNRCHLGGGQETEGGLKYGCICLALW